MGPTLAEDVRADVFMIKESLHFLHDHLQGVSRDSFEIVAIILDDALHDKEMWQSLEDEED